ncbi:MAG: segregation/condensation protein A [Clostridia bacterium]|nr:segregation/condensation protein A [Clostridia bacterium]
MLNNNKYEIKLENFQGPLDLLLHLIEKNQINIYDIPIAKITDQYLSYIESIDYLDLDWASEFLVMAATLLAIKARMLLPKPPQIVEEEENDPREELVVRLLEYKHFKEAALFLQEKEREMLKVFLRKLDEGEFLKRFAPQNPVENLTVNDLFKAFKVILEKKEEPEPTYQISREEISIQECMADIMNKLTLNRKITFNDLFIDNASRLRIIVTFLALLELIRLKKVGFFQKDAFGKIIIFLRDECL